MHYYIFYITIFIMPHATSCTLYNPWVLIEALKEIIWFMSVTEVGILPVLELAPDMPMHRSQTKWANFNNEANTHSDESVQIKGVTQLYWWLDFYSADKPFWNN